jgi:hypothetical protein
MGSDRLFRTDAAIDDNGACREQQLVHSATTTGRRSTLVRRQSQGLQASFPDLELPLHLGAYVAKPTEIGRATRREEQWKQLQMLIAESTMAPITGNECILGILVKGLSSQEV